MSIAKTKDNSNSNIVSGQLMEILRAKELQKIKNERIAELRDKQTIINKTGVLSAPQNIPTNPVPLPLTTSMAAVSTALAASGASASQIAAPIYENNLRQNRNMAQYLAQQKKEELDTIASQLQEKADISNLEASSADNGTIDNDIILRVPTPPPAPSPATSAKKEIRNSIFSDLRFPKSKNYHYVWEIYWPFQTETDLDLRMVYTGFDGKLVKKWSAVLPTPTTQVFVPKDLLLFELESSQDTFNFDLKLESSGANNTDSTIINTNSHSEKYPFNLGHILTQNTYQEAVSVIGYYASVNNYYNQLSTTLDKIDVVKNFVFCCQFFFLHIMQSEEPVKLRIRNSTHLGENSIEIEIETQATVVVKENEKIITHEKDLSCVTKTIYIGGKYFLTHAIFRGDFGTATSKAKYLALASVVNLSFHVVFPDFVSHETLTPQNDHQRFFLRLIRDVLPQLS